VDERTMYECMNILGLVDSIMEPGVTRTTLAFHNASGGDAKTAIELLADHYRGLAQMANMLVDWLVLTGVSPSAPLLPAHWIGCLTPLLVPAHWPWQGRTGAVCTGTLKTTSRP
jgi:hypothetical protein